MFGNLSHEPINTRNVKVARSVLEKIKIRVKKMYVNWEDQIDFFNSKKKINLKLEYYEAHYLEELVKISFAFIDDEFTANNALILQNTLNQKLA